jgi:hypothetical protein
LISPAEICVVIGSGRLQFYPAPDVACPTPGVVVILKDEVVVYGVTRDDRWASVAYFHGESPTGWVRLSRLKHTGWTVGPKP